MQFIMENFIVLSYNTERIEGGHIVPDMHVLPTNNYQHKCHILIYNSRHIS